MVRTVPADYIGKQNLGYVLLAFPSRELKARVNALLAGLTAALPGAIWPMPPEQLHITLCEIIQPKSYSQDKEALFNLHRKQYDEAPAEILATVPKFSVMFDTIEASPQAIILKASDSTRFNSIRARLVAAMPFPGETRTPPDITHCSIARYLKEVDLEKVQRIVATHSLTIKEEITEFQLVRTTVPPLQEYKTLKTFPLAASQTLS